MGIGIDIILYDGTTPQANLSNIQAKWWDVEELKDCALPTGKTDVAITDANGHCKLDLSNVSGFSIGSSGFLVLYQLNATDHELSKIFAGKVTTSDVTGGVEMKYDSGWTRHVDWPDLPAPVDGVQKVSGLVAVYDIETAGNSIAVNCTGTGTHNINWGDGTSSTGIASGTTTTHTYNYDDADLGSSTIVGRSDTQAVTFTASTDTVNCTGHGYVDGQVVNFASITTTTGISTYTRYYVRDVTADSFKVASTRGGTAIALTNDGSGTVFVPLYKCAIVTVTPQDSTNMTGIDLTQTPTNMRADAVEPWLDLVINGASLTSINVTNFKLLERCWIGQHACTNMSYMFNGCYSIQSVPLFDTSSVTNMSYMFNGCYSIQSVPLFDTSSATNMSNMFSGCYSLQSVPLFDTSSATNISSVFRYCYSLQSVPLFDTSSVTNMSGMFRYCYSIQSVPLFDTSSVTDMSYMFKNCYSLQSVPLFDTSSVTSMAYMFDYCYSLQSVPLFNTSSVTDMSGIFRDCYSLRRAALEGTAVDIDYSYCNLGPEALDEIYENLANVTSQTCTVTNNWGTSSDDPTKAPSGWTIIGS